MSTVRVLLTACILMLLATVVAAEDECPANSHPGYVGSGCRCDMGYQRSGNRCVESPALRQQSSPSFRSLPCKSGYKEIDGECKQVRFPENANSESRSSQPCNIGYKRVGENCREMDNAELRELVRKLTDTVILQAATGSSSDCSSGFDACEDECDDQFYSYSDEEKCVEACEEGEDACD